MRTRQLIVAGTVNARPIGQVRRPNLDEIEALLTRPAWHADAACREHPEVNFFPERGERSAPAVAVCVGCLVREECRAAAVSNGERDGIWGGLSTPQRRRGLIDPPPPDSSEPRREIVRRLVCPLCQERAATDNSLAIHLAASHGLRGAGQAVKAERRRLVAMAVEELARRAA